MKGQTEFDFEAEARDRALDLLEEHRAPLVEVAKSIARSLALANGRVTSTEVVREMCALGYGEALDQVDRRFLGAVFRAGNGWFRIGYENSGSHKRPVSIWGLRQSAMRAG